MWPGHRTVGAWPRLRAPASASGMQRAERASSLWKGTRPRSRPWPGLRTGNIVPPPPTIGRSGSGIQARVGSSIRLKVMEMRFVPWPGPRTGIWSPPARGAARSCSGRTVRAASSASCRHMAISSPCLGPQMANFLRPAPRMEPSRSGLRGQAGCSRRWRKGLASVASPGRLKAGLSPRLWSAAPSGSGARIPGSSSKVFTKRPSVWERSPGLPADRGSPRAPKTGVYEFGLSIRRRSCRVSKHMKRGSPPSLGRQMGVRSRRVPTMALSTSGVRALDGPRSLLKGTRTGSIPWPGLPGATRLPQRLQTGQSGSGTCPPATAVLSKDTPNL